MIEKAQYPAFLKAIEYGEGMVDGAIETTAIQRALGFTSETEKAFQTGVKMTVVETMPPSENLLKFNVAEHDRVTSGASTWGRLHHRWTPALVSVTSCGSRAGVGKKEPGLPEGRYMCLLASGIHPQWTEAWG